MKIKNNLKGGEQKEGFRMAIRVKKADLKTLSVLLSIFLAISTFFQAQYVLTVIFIIFAVVLWRLD
ncbi:MAG TPA: hypothetical protein VI977_05605 [archaeon]|nr:hypothetical protein [archaeon]